jgi:fructose/tagatose bisphosphate aldolase
MMSVVVGQKQSEVNARSKKLVSANRSQSVDDVAAAVGISHGTCHKLLTDDDLNMSRVSEH